MFIAHVLFSVSPESRPVALETLVKEVEAVRAMPGCVTYIPFLDPTDDQGVGVMQEWQSAEAFGGYTGSDIFAEILGVLRPLLVAPPVSKRFDAKLIDA